VLRFETDVILNILPCSAFLLAWTDLQCRKCNANFISIDLNGFSNKLLKKMSFILPLFIHNSRSKHSRKSRSTASNLHKHHLSEMSANNCFQCGLSGPSLWTIVELHILAIFNSNNLFKRGSFRFKAILSYKLPKTVLCFSQSSHIKFKESSVAFNSRL